MLDPVRLTELGRVSEARPSPDGAWLAVSVQRLDEEERYVHDLYRVPFDLGEPTRLTAGPWDDRAPRFREDGALLFLSNRAEGRATEDGEDERWQIWCLPSEGGEPRRLTDEPLGISSFETGKGVIAAIGPVWPAVEHDRQRAHAAEIRKRGPSLLCYTAMPVRHWDHWEPIAAPHLIVYDENGAERRDLTPDYDRELRPETELGVDPNGDFVVVTVSRTDEDRLPSSHVRRFDLSTDARTDLGDGVRGEHGEIRISPSGHRIACVRTHRFDDRCHERELVLFDHGSTEARVLVEDWDRWPSPAAFLDDDTLVVRFDDHGEVRLARVDLRDGSHTPLDLPGSYSNVRALADGLVAIGHSLTQPPRPLRISGGEPHWLPELSGIEPSAVHGCEIDRFEVEASDGVSVETLLVRPSGEGPWPMVLWIHGGPISHFGNQWHWRWNPLVMLERGYAVALPNPRGSTGYGFDFIAGIWGNRWGEQCFDDLMRVTDALAQRADVDATRMAAMGGSFGGYMTNWIGGQTDRFRALVTHASIYDFRAFYGTTDYPAYWGLHQASTPWSGEIDRYSPHRFVSKWKTPTLILHGEKDHRVPIGEALGLFEGLQAHGTQSELVVFPDENHWIRKPRNIRAWYGAVLRFLDEHLAK